VNQFAKIHDELKLSGSDVLFIYSLQQRHLHNKALGKDVGNEILKKTNPTFYKQATQVQGVLETLDEFERRLATAAPGTTTPGVAVPVNGPANKGQSAYTKPFAVVAVVAVVVWIALRRKQEPPKRPSLPKAKSRTSRPGDRADRTPVPGAAGKSTTGSGKSTTGSGKSTTGSGKSTTGSGKSKEPDAEPAAPDAAADVDSHP